MKITALCGKCSTQLITIPEQAVDKVERRYVADWSTFFVSGNRVSDDFMATRSSSRQRAPKKLS